MLPQSPAMDSVATGMHGERPSTLEPEHSTALWEKLLTALGNIGR
jgi:hypothetical protein